MNLLELRRVRVGYHRQPLLPPVDLSLAPGVFMGVVGPNGSGKTTLVKTILGLLSPVEGEVVFPGGKRPRFGYVPQRESVDLSFPLTAFEIVLMGRYGIIGAGRRPKAKDMDAASAALKDVGAADLAVRPYHALSGGQRQRVLVARALAGEPEILVLDEPTTGMDLPSERSMLDLVASFTRRQIAVVMVSHHLGLVSDYAELLALCPGPGRAVEIGPREEILTSARLTGIYGRSIAVRSVDGHAVIFVEHECHTGETEKT
jgi:ABC-type Mn2+/Zn2+ transport system ATPase subunit